jgi:AraC family L-rhamnose operon transcriptional activator RhaR
MEWIPTLRRHVSRVDLGGAQAEVLSWAYSPHLCDNVLHRHTYFEVCTVGRWGGGTFTLNGRAHDIAPGDTFFARPGEPHRIQNTSPRPMELFWVAFALAPGTSLGPAPAPALEAEDSPAKAFAHSMVAVRAGDAGTLAIWRALQASAEGGGRRGVLESLARALLLSIFGAGAEPERPVSEAEGEDEHGVARLAVRYIHDNLDRRLPVEEVAAHVHVSPRHLARLVRAFTGTSPADYAEAARIQRARHLLRGERASVKQAARVLGYADVQHFTRAFSRRVGTSPAAFKGGREGAAAKADADAGLV